MHGLAQYGLRGGQMMAGYYGHHWPGIGAAIVLFVIAAVIVGILVWALRRPRQPEAPVVSAAGLPAPAGVTTVVEDQALRIARERLARGEIDVDHYTAIVEALKGLSG